jgi:hypothetical protein
LSSLVACGARTTATLGNPDFASGPRTDASAEVDASAEGTVTVQGTLGGRPFTVRNAIGLLEEPLFPGSVTIDLQENVDRTCDIFKTSVDSRLSAVWNANEEDLAITVYVDGMNGPPVVAGTYEVVARDSGITMMTADAIYKQRDGDCGIIDSTIERATSGRVIVSAIDSATISGSFDLAFPNGDSVAGRFSGPLCTLQIRFYGGTTPPPVCLH